MIATDHARLGALSIEAIGPDKPKAIAPAADAAWLRVRRRNAYIPSAAIGSGRATHRLNDTTSDGSRRMATVIGIHIWFRASGSAD
jgi:hypothetical protein